VGKADRIQVPMIAREVSKRLDAGHSKVHADEPPLSPDLHQSTVEHCTHPWRQLGFAGLRATEQGAQNDAFCEKWEAFG
jgi:hypothetical protein